MITTSEFAIDTNILLYTFDEKVPIKYTRAAELLQTSPLISSQNMSEFINVLLNRWKYPKRQLGAAIEEILYLCAYVPTVQRDYTRAIQLVERYDFQFFDAIIVATALEAGCHTLYTEDLQHGQIISDQLRIVNPFVELA